MKQLPIVLLFIICTGTLPLQSQPDPSATQGFYWPGAATPTPAVAPSSPAPVTYTLPAAPTPSNVVYQKAASS